MAHRPQAAQCDAQSGARSGLQQGRSNQPLSAIESTRSSFASEEMSLGLATGCVQTGAT